MISDGVVPTNEGRGYILRRLIRRAIRAFNQVSTQWVSLSFLIEIVVDMYKDQYPDLQNNIEKIIKLYVTEENLFINTLIKGNQEIKNLLNEKKSIDAKDAFKLFETFGFPYELTKEIAAENNININDDEYFKYFEEHKKKSKTVNKENSDI
jgi:alanyl-tRNA synthetase